MQSISPKHIFAAGLLLVVPIVGCGVWQWAALTSSYPFVADTIRIAVFLLPVRWARWPARVAVLDLLLVRGAVARSERGELKPPAG